MKRGSTWNTSNEVCVHCTWEMNMAAISWCHTFIFDRRSSKNKEKLVKDFKNLFLTAYNYFIIISAEPVAVSIISPVR